MTIGIVAGDFPAGTNMDLFDVGILAGGTVQSQAATSYSITIGDEQLTFTGSGFTYDGAGNPTGGTVTGLEDRYLGQVAFNLSGFSIGVTSFVTWAASHDTAAAKAAIFAGSDSIIGGPLGDLLRAYAGNDAISGGGGDDTIDAGVGDDTIDGGAGHDVILTGAGSDVINVALGQSAVGAALSDSISDWSSSDFLSFAGRPAGASDYVETHAADFASATVLANGLIASGSANLVVVAVGADLVVFADSANNNGTADDAVILNGRGLDDVSVGNFTVVAAPGPVTPTPAPAPVTPTPAPAPAPSAGASASALPAGTVGDDYIIARAGATEVHAGSGNDTIIGAATADYLRGDDGNDVISGGPAFDDINGNAGDDTAHGNAGDDWVVGGKGNDQLSGDGGNDIVWGNLNNDSLEGGDGNDQLRGGQGDDVLDGGAGDDFLSGDRGNDTITGGGGSDIFHGSQDAGIDRVMDFNFGQGDRVLLDPGTTYTLKQIGADAVLDMGGGNQMILVGVQAAALPAGWIL